MVTAARIAVPLGLEHSVLCGAQTATTRIVSPLGTVSIAANSLAVTAESLCYMPGYGIAAAATTLVGQSLGAGRRDLARSFARLTVLLGMVLMSCTGILMFLLAPQDVYKRQLRWRADRRLRPRGCHSPVPSGR